MRWSRSIRWCSILFTKVSSLIGVAAESVPLLWAPFPERVDMVT
jgi:hypothetical protein